MLQLFRYNNSKNTEQHRIPMSKNQTYQIYIKNLMLDFQQALKDSVLWLMLTTR